jgi:hypothetical protein
MVAAANMRHFGAADYQNITSGSIDTMCLQLNPWNVLSCVHLERVRVAIPSADPSP